MSTLSHLLKCMIISRCGDNVNDYVKALREWLRESNSQLQKYKK